MVVATREHREELANRLKARGLDTARAARQGRYVTLDAAETLSLLMLDGIPDTARFNSLIGGIIQQAKKAAGNENASIAVFGEAVALLWTQGNPEAAIRIEYLWNELARTHSFSLRCAYPLKTFSREEDSELFLQVCSQHTHVIPSDNYTGLTSDADRLRKISHLQQQAAALEAERAERKEIRKELDRREIELADVLENAIEGVQQIGPDREILWANKAMLNLLGYAPQEYLGQSVSKFCVGDVFDDFWRALMQHQDIYDFPAEFKCRDGSIKHVLIHANGLWEREQLVYARCFVRDITETRRMQQALQLANDLLEMRVHERTAELARKHAQIQEQSEVLEKAHTTLRELSSRLLQVQEEERRAIARDLHDGTGQALALLSVNLVALEAAARQLSPELATGLSENAGIVRQITAELRTASYLLHPPLLDELGLEAAIRSYTDGFAQRSGIEVHLDMPGGWTRLPKNLETTIFRVIQECFTNIHRHSGSPSAGIRLSREPGTLVLEVKDEGKGIPEEKLRAITSSGATGVGFGGMRERVRDFNGTLEISSPGQGTQIKVLIPLDFLSSQVNRCVETCS